MMISGMGVVSAAGIGPDASMQSMLLGTRSPAPTKLFDTPLVNPVFELGPLPIELPGQRTLALTLMAVDQALERSAIDMKGLRVGVCLGTTVASQLNDMEFYRAYRTDGNAPMDAVDRYIMGDLSAEVARRHCLTGPTLTIVNACSSGTDAIGVAMSWLMGGVCDVAIAGGADEMNRVPLAGFHSLGITSPEPCRPFDRNRRGLNLGEGAGVIIIERPGMRETASPLYAAGYGASADAYHLTAPHPEGIGLRSAIATALKQAGAPASEIAFINAHGTATPDNDKVEGRVLADLFGPEVKFISTKCYTGHTLGAAGGIEAVFAAQSLLDGILPPAAGFEELDPEIGVAPVTTKLSITGRYALSTSLAFGGNNAALVIGTL